jgi:PadR family transcriptional regulator, regulatory protein PadR
MDPRTFHLDSLGKRGHRRGQDSLGHRLMAKEKPDLVYGTLDMLILKALQHEPRHGLGIADRIQQISRDILRVEQGSLYPALYRLESQGWIKAEWGVSDNNRRARFYKLTPAGRKQLAAETEHWSRITAGINLVLKGA